MTGSAAPDLLLVNPASREKVYQSLGKELSAIEPPIWAGLMATYVRQKGFGVEILDAEAEGLGAEAAARECVDRRPALVAVVAYGHQPSASTQVMPSAGALVRELKKLAPDLKVIMLGGHVAALPERTLREEQADFVAGGEGLAALVELLGALRAGDRDYGKVADLYYRDGDRVVAPVRHAPLVTDLDAEMPGIAWDLLPMGKYRAHNWHCMGNTGAGGELVRWPYAACYTTLGCPFKCSFCCIQAPFRTGERALGMKANSYRFWSPKRVVDDLELLARQYGVRNVKFADELFVLRKSHVREICQGIIERGLDLNIWAYARVDTVRDEEIDLLKRAGVNWLAFGIEAANAKVRNDVQKGFDQQDIRTTLDKVRRAGINVIGNYIFGLPEDNLDTMQETLDLALELKCEFANFYCAMAYPGSKLYDQAIAGGWRLPESWSGYSQHSVDALPLPTRHLSGPEVLAFRDRAFQVHYADPGYLAMVGEKFGQPIVEHLRQMASHRLERRHVHETPPPSRAPIAAPPVPEISVIIPTYNRAASLARVLAGLRAQTLPPERFEVVVVDDGSTDATAETADRLIEAPGPRGRLLRQANRGPAAARNAGLAAARGDLIVFLGDDTLPAPDLLEQHAGYHRQHNTEGRLAVVGYITWPAGARPTPFSRFASREGPQFNYAYMTPGGPLSYHHFYTSNLSFRRGLLDGILGPFDEGFTEAMWEDVELGYRLMRRGMVLHFHPAAIAYHDHPTTLAAFGRRTREVGRVSRQLLAKHPELETDLLGSRDLDRICRLTTGLGGLLPVVDFLDRRLRIPLPRVVYRALLTAQYARGAKD